MDLYILRHTSAADPHGYAQDADRPLTETGRREARTVSDALEIIGHKLELVLTSPYLRARETAGIVASALKIDAPEDCGFLLPGADSTALMMYLSQRRSQSIMLVGHAPDLSYLISTLCYGAESAGIEVAKGTLALLDVERPVRRRRCRLSYLLPLKVMETLAK